MQWRKMFCKFRNKSKQISFEITVEEAFLFLDLPLGRFYAIKGIDWGFTFEMRKINRIWGEGGRKRNRYYKRVLRGNKSKTCSVGIISAFWERITWFWPKNSITCLISWDVLREKLTFGGEVEKVLCYYKRVLREKLTFRPKLQFVA